MVHLVSVEIVSRAIRVKHHLAADNKDVKVVKRRIKEVRLKF